MRAKKLNNFDQEKKKLQNRTDVSLYGITLWTLGLNQAWFDLKGFACFEFKLFLGYQAITTIAICGYRIVLSRKGL